MTLLNPSLALRRTDHEGKFRNLTKLYKLINHIKLLISIRQLKKYQIKKITLKKITYKFFYNKLQEDYLIEKIYAM